MDVVFKAYSWDVTNSNACYTTQTVEIYTDNTYSTLWSASDTSISLTTNSLSQYAFTLKTVDYLYVKVQTATVLKLFTVTSIVPGACPTTNQVTSYNSTCLSTYSQDSEDFNKQVDLNQAPRLKH